MKNKIIEAMESYCTYYDDEDLQFRSDYSGRSMYGRKCVGITCYEPMETIIDLIAYVIDSIQSDDSDIEAKEIVEEIGSVRTDNMGMDTILYFPKLKIED